MKFPDVPTFRGFQAPGRFEADIRDLEVVQGEVPADLDGAFYRVGPDPQFPPLLGDDIFLNGDGMVSMFRFEDGRVDFTCRWVRTPKFLAEREAGRSLFGAYRNPFTDDPGVRGISRGTANTNLLWHAGRMLALKEDSHPVEIDPLTLGTIGPWDYGGALRSATATAHPKVDAETGTLVFFGYAARGETTPDIAYYEADAHGAIVFERWLTAPYASMVHDFAVTENHVVFPVVPLVSDLQRLKGGLPHFAWDPSKPVCLGVLPRRDPAAEVRWFVGDPRFASHTMNAFEEDGRIHIDMSVGDSVVFPFFPEINGAPFDPEAATPYMSRWTLDLRRPTDDFTQTRLSDVPGEFPRINERRAIRSYRYGYMSMQSGVPDPTMPSSASGMRFDLIGRVDLVTGTTTTHYVGDTSATQEPLFVPRRGATGEGEGYVMALVNRYADMRSDLLILDAENVDGAPLATVRLPLRLRNGLHGTWVDGEDLAVDRTGREEGQPCR
ncbi:carotenoid oxygenase family protein [Streptomyces sp. 11x1]|uniref:carotenoid oxygenase family protein n=1 Tax=Streptomyces sp. 11x1 TaxID=3038642 RepID=UPI00292F6E8E|nr:carotenoid oxygenase family protein [Streptomyces sp. 11x1]WNZ06289.1 carotenoid oxygenase family protein [Streptomyces sp. 11x1]